MADEKHVADKRPDDDKKYEDVREKRTGAHSHVERREGEDLTPTPTQDELDKMMSGLSDEELAKQRKEKDKARDEAGTHHPTAESTPPTMTQEENDQAHLDARPGDAPPDVINPEKDKDKEHKEMEADKPAGYQTRATKPK